MLIVNHSEKVVMLRSSWCPGSRLFFQLRYGQLIQPLSVVMDTAREYMDPGIWLSSFLRLQDSFSAELYFPDWI
jgi:hypothetical protein